MEHTTIGRAINDAVLCIIPSSYFRLIHKCNAWLHSGHTSGIIGEHLDERTEAQQCTSAPLAMWVRLYHLLFFKTNAIDYRNPQLSRLYIAIACTNHIHVYRQTSIIIYHQLPVVRLTLPLGGKCLMLMIIQCSVTINIHIRQLLPLAIYLQLLMITHGKRLLERVPVRKSWHWISWFGLKSDLSKWTHVQPQAGHFSVDNQVITPWAFLRFSINN